MSSLCPLPSPTTNPLRRHTYITSYKLSELLSLFFVFSLWKSNGFLGCTFLSQSSSSMQCASTKINNSRSWFVFIYLFLNPSFLQLLSEVKKRNGQSGFWQPCYITSDMHGLLYNFLIDLNNEDQKITSFLVCRAMNHRLFNHCQIKQLACDYEKIHVETEMIMSLLFNPVHHSC